MDTDTPTTPASAAARLTDEEILKLAKDCDGLVSTDYATGEPDYFGDLEVKKAAVLRDYVRLRKMNVELCKCVNDAVLQNCALCESKNTVACDTDGFCSERKWKKILAEAEKGEVK